jgi:hypothetical protein
MTDYCDNVVECGNYAAPGHRLCYSCLNKKAEEQEQQQKPKPAHIDKHDENAQAYGRHHKGKK